MVSMLCVGVAYGLLFVVPKMYHYEDQFMLLTYAKYCAIILKVINYFRKP